MSKQVLKFLKNHIVATNNGYSIIPVQNMNYEMCARFRNINHSSLIAYNNSTYARILVPKIIDDTIIALRKPYIHTCYKCSDFDYICAVVSGEFYIYPSYFMLNYHSSTNRWVRHNNSIIHNARNHQELITEFDLSHMYSSYNRHQYLQEMFI